MKNMLGISLQEALGPIKDLLDKLIGPNGRQWFIAFKRFLRKEDPWVGGIMFKNIVKTIDIENKTNSEVLKKKLDEVYTKNLSEYIYSVIRPTRSIFGLTSQLISTIDVIFVSVEDLGFTDGATMREIIEKASIHGLIKCPIELVDQLSFQYSKDEKHDGVIVVSNPTQGENFIFEIYKSEIAKIVDGKTCREFFPLIRTQDGSPNNWWGNSTVFAFTFNA